VAQYSSLSDQELTVLLMDGSHAAFTEIYDRYWNKLMAIAYNHTKDKSAAKEIVQELFVSLWKRKDKVIIHTLNSYLVTAIKFAVYKQIERERRRREIENQEYKQGSYTEDELNIEARFLQEYINGQIELLPEKCRLVFNYSRVKGMTIPEIAREMEISEKTAEGHLTKGLKTIRLNLKDSGMLGVLICSSIHEWLR
jgi:RNA polymerase sigma-70 factor (family 1)